MGKKKAITKGAAKKAALWLTAADVSREMVRGAAESAGIGFRTTQAIIRLVREGKYAEATKRYGKGTVDSVVAYARMTGRMAHAAVLNGTNAAYLSPTSVMGPVHPKDKRKQAIASAITRRVGGRTKNDLAYFLAGCTSCGADIGQPCVTSSWKEAAHAHYPRVEEAYKALKAITDEEKAKMPARLNGPRFVVSYELWEDGIPVGRKTRGFATPDEFASWYYRLARNPWGSLRIKRATLDGQDIDPAAVLGVAANNNPALARRNPSQSDVGIYQDILVHLRALQWLFWQTHWAAKGANYYGDHLLLERLYKGIDESFDALGERMVAYFGPKSVDPSVISRSVATIVHGRPFHDKPMKMLLALEERLQDSIRLAWKANQESGDKMSLGLDDFLMGLANERDTAIYLLKQRLGG